MSAQERKIIEKKRRDKERKQREMRKYLEMEAELGSDNEENDDAARAINRDGDAEENEEGLDEDLKDFVVYAGDDQEIDDEASDLYDKFQKDMEMQDRINIQKTMEAVLFGMNNKKRKRHEVGLDDMDDPVNRRKKLMEKRLKQIQENDQDFAPEDLIYAAAEA